MSYEIQGTVKAVMEQQTFPSGFTKREFVVTTQDRYPQDIKLECVKDRVSMLDGVRAGEQVTAHFDIRGNEHNGRYYVSLNCWKLDRGAAGGSAGDYPQPEGRGPGMVDEAGLPF